MVVSFLGLTGPSGVLPHHYTRLLIERLRQKDESLRDFLDLFNHRLISFFFRAWEKHRFPAAYARARLGSSGSAEDRFTGYLFSLVGLGTPGLRERFPLDDETLLHYAGLFADGHRPATSLEGLLASYFDVPVRILQFQGQWLSLKPEDLATLARPGSPEAENAQLGKTAIVGERVWDVQSRFRVKLGPLDYERYCDFIPSGTGLPPLWHLVRAYVGPSLDFDVQVTLRAGQAPPLRLDAGGEARLGWNTWLRTRPTESDFEEVVFVLPEF
jgi:type VI secretion system protein ImpH